MKRLQILLLLLVSSFHNMAAAQEKTTARWSAKALDSSIQSHKGEPYITFDFTSLDGKKFTNESCKGKVTFISLWFESCGGCRAEFPQVNKLYERLKQNPNYQFVAVTYDAIETLPEFIKANKINFPVATVNNYDVFGKMRYGMGCPGIVILDPKGRIGFLGIYATTDDEDHDYAISIGKIEQIMHDLL